MKIRRLIIKNFRGIREMEWNIQGDMVCLIGPGDSTKTTILLALEFLFSPSWTLSVSDIDFYNANPDQPIEITGVVTELPESLIEEDKFGLYLGFWDTQNGQIYEEQKNDSCEKALQVRLEIGNDLEPKWFVVSLQTNGREPKQISASERRELGVAKIGNYVDTDLAWGRNSALSRLTQKEDISQIPSLLAEAERKVLQALKNIGFDSLTAAIESAKSSAKSLGVDAQEELLASLDPTRVSIRQGAVALFDGGLPFSLRGAGSRRLMAMAVHKASVNNGAVLLIDEIENSLEPYRVRHLIRQLRPKPDDKHQVIFTTHSSVAVVECRSNELYVVRSENGKTNVLPVHQTLQSQYLDAQAIVRSVPEAFLSKKVIVCEGKTESGFLISLDLYFWQQRHADKPGEHAYQTMAEAGALPVESPKAGGSEAPKYAVALAKLGYKVAYFGDSDRDLNPSAEDMRQQGIKVIVWDENVEIERRLCRDLPLEGLKELVDLAISLDERENASQLVWDAVNRQLNNGHTSQAIQDFDTLIHTFDEQIVRDTIGAAADKGCWFKRRGKGEKFGELVSRYLDPMHDTPTMKTLQALEGWCYERPI
ncbi:MAG: AAA family ATPase [Anaerolineales bacterium]